MTLLASAVVLFGALTVLNLILTYGVIRRLREQGELLAQRVPPGFGAPSGEVAETVGSFSIADLDGQEISDTNLSDGTVVAFFSPGCQPCEELLPRFVDRIRDGGYRRERVLAVLAGGDTPQQYVDPLAPVATVIAGDQVDKVIAAFGVKGFPVVCRVTAGGGIEEIDRELKTLPEPVPA